jgi:hypothetical protein
MKAEDKRDLGLRIFLAVVVLVAMTVFAYGLGRSDAETSMRQYAAEKARVCRTIRAMGISEFNTALSRAYYEKYHLEFTDETPALPGFDCEYVEKVSQYHLK